VLDISASRDPGRAVGVVDNKTTCGHVAVMKQAKVSDLKAHLSAYLAGVRAGETLIVCDRATPIARLVPYEDGDAAVGLEVLAASRPKSDLRLLRVVTPSAEIDVVQMLREDRDGR
jgi:prevent-host-death family protein